MDIDELVTVVRLMGKDVGRWRSLLRFPTAIGRRTRLRGHDNLDVWLQTWPTGEATQLHDYGNSSAAYTVIAGSLHEVRVRRSGATGLTPVRRHVPKTQDGRGATLADTLRLAGRRSRVGDLLATARSRLQRLSPLEAWDAHRAGAFLVDIRPHTRRR